MPKLRNEALRRGSGEARRTDPMVSFNSGIRRADAVYFLRWTDGAIKIGFTSNFPKRLAQHRDECARHGSSCYALAVVNGSRNDEAEVHRYFAAFAFSGQRELFRPDPQLLRYVRCLRDLYFVEVEDDFAGRPAPRDFEVVQFSDWEPTESRSKPPAEIEAPLFGNFKDESAFDKRVLTGDDYYTPKALLDTVRSFLGTIDLDPASFPVANRVVGARRFYGKEENGLEQCWRGRVWLNPPFEKWPEFATKLINSLPGVDELLALASLPAMSTRYMRPCLEACACLCVLAGRLEFWGPQVDKGEGAGAAQGHVVLYYGHRRAEFARAFSAHGSVLQPVSLLEGLP